MSSMPGGVHRTDAADPASDGAGTMTGAILRLSVSRERVHQALLEAAARDDRRPRGAEDVSHRRRPSRIGERIRTRYPLVDIGWPFVRAWWERQPVHRSLQSATDEARHLTLPAIRRHPVLSMAIAGLAGAGLVSLGPWRWTSRQIRPLGRHAGRFVGAQVRRLAAQTVLAGVMMLVAGKAAEEKRRNEADDRSGPDDRDHPEETGEEMGAEAWRAARAGAEVHRQRAGEPVGP